MHLPISITAPAVLRLAGAAARTKHKLAFASGCVGKRQTLSIALDGERPGGQVCTLGSKVIMELFEVGELQQLQEFCRWWPAVLILCSSAALGLNMRAWI